MATNYVVQWGSKRISFVPGNDNFGINKDYALFILSKHEDNPLVSALLPMVFDENHVAMRHCPAILPAEAYFHSFSRLGDEQQAQVLYRAHYAMNKLLREKRVLKPEDKEMPIYFVSKINLAIMFGKFPITRFMLDSSINF